jgi:hypothetical protein
MSAHNNEQISGITDVEHMQEHVINPRNIDLYEEIADPSIENDEVVHLSVQIDDFNVDTWFNY